MKKKLLGIFVCTLLIATTIPVIGTMNLNKIQVNEKDIISDGNMVKTLQDYPWEPSGAGNDDHIYHTGNVSIGTNDEEGKLMVVNDEGKGLFICKDDPMGEFINLGSFDGEGNRVVIGGGHTLFNVCSSAENGFYVGGDNAFVEVDAGDGVVALFSGRVRGADAVNDDEFATKKQVDSVVVSRFTPDGTSDVSGSVGDTAWDDSFFYVKTIDGWKRASLETWASSSSSPNIR